MPESSTTYQRFMMISGLLIPPPHLNSSEPPTALRRAGVSPRCPSDTAPRARSPIAKSQARAAALPSASLGDRLLDRLLAGAWRHEPCPEWSPFAPWAVPQLQLKPR